MPLIAANKKASSLSSFREIEMQQGIIVTNDDWQGVRGGHVISLLRCSGQRVENVTFTVYPNTRSIANMQYSMGHLAVTAPNQYTL
jgi:hypothetical protein